MKLSKEDCDRAAEVNSLLLTYKPTENEIGDIESLILMLNSKSKSDSFGVRKIILDVTEDETFFILKLLKDRYINSFQFDLSVQVAKINEERILPMIGFKNWINGCITKYSERILNL